MGRADVAAVGSMGPVVLVGGLSEDRFNSVPQSWLLSKLFHLADGLEGFDAPVV
jgi:hypothetical protein